MINRFDIVGLGCSAVDDLLYVDSYPQADAKVVVNRRERQCGGLTATALVAAARFGANCAYAGVLGIDEFSGFIEDTLKREAIDTSQVTRDVQFRAIHSTIIVGEDTGSRNIFPYLAKAKGFGSKSPPEELIRNAGALFVDHVDAQGMIAPATLARSVGVPVIGDIESVRSPACMQLMDLVDHLIVSSDFALQVTATSHPADAARALWSQARKAVVVTCGAQGCWHISESNIESPAHFPAFKVKTVDTTGCGDVFHGVYAAALVENRSLLQRLRFASAAAALIATQPGGQAGIPTRAQIQTFLRDRDT